MKAFARIRAAIRNAIGRVTPKPVDPKLLQIPTELQKAMHPYRNAPQWVRLLVLYRITKRQYRARRKGLSAKSPSANRKRGTPRLGRCDGIGSYDYFKKQVAINRAADRRAQS